MQQAHRLGIKSIFIGSDSWGSQDLTKLCGKDCDGYYFSTHYSAESASPAAKKFIAAYTAAYSNTPGRRCSPSPMTPSAFSARPFRV